MKVRHISCVLSCDGLAITEATNKISNTAFAISQYFLFFIYSNAGTAAFSLK